jgi:hypothetical protein
MAGEMGGTAVFDWNALLWDPIRQNGERLAGFLPNLINALYILAFGWAFAFVVQLASRIFLKHIGFDKIAEKTGIAGVLSENGISMKPGEWLSRLSYWVVMIAVTVKLLGELRLNDAAGGVDLFSGFVFQSLGLLAIFIIGLFMSVVLSKIVHATSTNLKVKSPGAYSRTLKWTILAFTILLVLRQIAVPMQFIFVVVGIVFVSICIAFIIAFGVGGAGWAAKVLDRISKKD